MAVKFLSSCIVKGIAMFEDFKQLTPYLGSSIILKSSVVLNQKTKQERPMESKLSWNSSRVQHSIWLQHL